VLKQGRNFERPGREFLLRLIPDGLMESRHMKEIMALALPAFGTILADPLMSLIDTACVGQAGSLQLAAMGPITAIFNFVFQVCVCAPWDLILMDVCWDR
jgi:Na+-driven multidrug efflux pump